MNLGKFLFNIIGILILLSFVAFIAFCFLGPAVLASIFNPKWLWLYVITIPLALWIGRLTEEWDNFPRVEDDYSFPAKESNDEPGYHISDDPTMIQEKQ